MNNNFKGIGIYSDVNEQINNLNPSNDLNEKEFDIIINKIGCYLFLISGKNINPTTLFLYIMSDKDIQQVVLKISSYPSVILILKQILNKYPNIVKSKMLKNKAIKINKSHKRKKYVIK
jgi:hypothetical protein